MAGEYYLYVISKPDISLSLSRMHARTHTPFFIIVWLQASVSFAGYQINDSSFSNIDPQVIRISWEACLHHKSDFRDWIKNRLVLSFGQMLHSSRGVPGQSVLRV